MAAAHPITAWLTTPVDQWITRMLQPPGTPAGAFSSPLGEAALLAPDTLSWRLFKNPAALFIGGVGAVLLELAEPRVRTGVWEYTSFRERPIQRLQRTALAAMLTVYGPRSRSTAMIAAVVRMHERIAGVTEAGVPFRASDPELLDWVHATAAFGILEATHLYVHPMSLADRDRLHAEGRVAADLYGAHGAPATQAQWDALLQKMGPRLEASQVVHEFLRILDAAAVLPGPARPLQHMLVCAGVQIVPPAVRERLQLGAPWRLGPAGGRAVTALAGMLDKMVLHTGPPAQACRRLGLPDDYLYRDGR